MKRWAKKPNISSPLTCTHTEQAFLIGLGHLAIEEALHDRSTPEPPSHALSSTVKEPAATFVTLTLEGKLRGCVGNLAAREPLYRSVMHNAVGAALRDTRFEPLTGREATDIAVHLSILSPLTPLSFESVDQLLDQLTPGKDGVVLKLKGCSSTYLPQVWRTITDKRAFLDSLCRKAGLAPDSWREPGMEILVYRVSEFGDARPE